MAWTAPMTAVANATFTASQFNTHVRDNLNETAVAKATTAGRIFVATGANALAERAISSATVATNEARANSAYGDTATAGPAVTVTTGTNALVMISAQMHSGTADEEIWSSYEVSGASTIAAADGVGVQAHSATTFDGYRSSACSHLTTLTAGSNTFTMKYKTDGTSAQFQNRHIIVIGL